MERAQALAEALPDGQQRQRAYGLAGQLRKQLNAAEAREAKERLATLAHDAAALVGSGELAAAVDRYRTVLAQTAEPVSPLSVALLAVAEAALAHAQRAKPGIVVPPEAPESGWWQAVWSRTAAPTPEAAPPATPEPPPGPAEPELTNEERNAAASERLWRIVQARRALADTGAILPSLPAAEKEAALAQRWREEFEFEVASEMRRLEEQKRYAK